MSRCTGHCCRRFPLGSFTPEELKARAEREEFLASPDSSLLGDYTGMKREIEVVADMVIWLGVEHRPRGSDERPSGFFHYYTCRHLQENGDCGIYHFRPRMCKEYPYGNPCEWEGCTLSPEDQKLFNIVASLPEEGMRPKLEVIDVDE